MNQKLKGLVAALLFTIAGVIGGALLFAITTDDLSAQATFEPIVAQAPPQLSESERALAALYEQVSPSVVSLSVLTGLSGGSGSGFVLDTQGHIMTNYHVVEGAEQIIVNFIDGTITRAEVVGLDPDSDLAVIDVDIPEERLFPVTFGDSGALTVGQDVVAIGSPFGQRWTLTRGIVSALQRSISGLGQYQIGAAIQTDTPINPGNSGGPLVNMGGQVVGVNSQILSESGTNAGVGFAVPSNLARRVASQLIERGEVRYSFLGIRGGDVNLQTMERLNLESNQRGVVIAETTPADGPAANAGLRPNDIITAIDGEEVIGFDTLIAYLAQETSPGDMVTMTILRDGESIQVPVTVSDRP